MRAAGGLILALVCMPAWAQETAEIEYEPPSPWRWNLIVNTTGRWQQDDGNITEPGDRDYDPTGENFGDWVSTFGGSIGYNEYLATVRFDSALYLNGAQAAPDASALIQRRTTDRFKNTFRLEYISATYSGRDASLTLGDFYVTLGRGLVLAVRKVDDVGVDNKLRGAEARVKVKGFKFHLFGGFLNIRNYEPGTAFAYQETGDLIGGGRIEYGWSKYLRLGAHVALIQPPKRIGTDGLPERSRTIGYAATIEMPRPVPWASLYLELARRERSTELSGIDGGSDGYGFYGNANFYWGPVTVLAEGKVYDNLLSLNPGDFPQASDPSFKLQGQRQIINRVAEPPTAERPLAIILRNRTVAGGRVRADYRIRPWLVPYASFGFYRDQDTEGSEAFVWAAFGGSRLKWDSGHASLEGGYRAEIITADQSILTRDIHWIADISQKIYGKYSAELFSAGRHATESAGRDVDGNFLLDVWVEGRLALSFKSTDGWSVTGAYEFYTKTPEDTKPHYFSIGGQYEFMEGSFVRALYGGERAGLKCSGGVCRQFPGFEGGRIEVNFRY